MYTRKEQMIQAIQGLINKQVGTSWRVFAGIIYQACRPEWRNKNGDPCKGFNTVSHQYLEALKAAQEWVDVDVPYVPK